eukprot:scaffold187891_cov17-Prasinocladus_malaysianus.AAC.1
MGSYIRRSTSLVWDFGYEYRYGVRKFVRVVRSFWPRAPIFQIPSSQESGVGGRAVRTQETTCCQSEKCHGDTGYGSEGSQMLLESAY